MKILLTGSEGNLGTALRHHLTAHEVVEISKANWKDVDRLLDHHVDCIIHCAYDLKNRIAEAPSQILDSNISTTAHLLELAKKNQVKQFCFVSTCAVYGDKGNTEETSSCAPVSINGLTKYLNEKIIIEFCQINQIKYQIYRPFNTYGGSDQFSILFHLANALKNQTPFQLNNNGLSQRDFIHVEDIAKIISQLITMNIHNEIINIGTGKATRIVDVVDTFMNTHGKVKIKNTALPEIEYSRANINKLQSYLHCEFIDVLDFLKR